MPAQPPPSGRTWCRLKIEITDILPEDRRRFVVEQGPFTRRVIIAAPRLVIQATWGALIALLAGSNPMLQPVLAWLAACLRVGG